jgi:hypothetical protein
MRKIIPLGYWNSNGIATAIVAVVNFFDGKLFDWAAYIGGTEKTWKEEDAYEEVKRHGCKLQSEFAVFLAEQQGHVDLTKGTYRL